MGHVDVAEKILEMMKDVDQMDINGNTALHHAAYMGQLSIVQKLLLKAKLIDKPNNLGQTPLMVAETYPRKDVADSMRAAILLNLGAKVDSVTIEDCDKDSRSVKLFVEAIDDETSKKLTRLHQAAKSGDADAVEFILQKGAMINARDINGWTPLHWAVRRNNLAAVRMLIEKGANADLTDNQGFTPLDAAVEEGFAEIVAALLEKITDIDKQDSRGRTLLHYATENGLVDVVRLLLTKANGIEVPDSEGNTPLDLLGKNAQQIGPLFVHKLESIPNPGVFERVSSYFPFFW